MYMMNNTIPRALGLTAILSGILAITADMVSIFTITADLSQMRMSLSLQNISILLVEKPHSQLVLGHYLALVAIPVVGISVVAHTSLGLKPSGKGLSRLFTFSGLFIVALGVAYHAFFGVAAEVVRNADPALIAAVNAYFEPLGILVSVLFLAMVVGWTLLILTGRTHYPRWVLLFSPLPVLATTTTFAFLLPVPNVPIRVFLMVTNMNLPITLWALVSTIVLWYKQDLDF